mgnify:CR=1 FL=1
MNESVISVLERTDNEDLKTLCDIITLGKKRLATNQRQPYKDICL